ncbi:dienelactone hydrolase family protein [Pseudanabaena sp. FACHB-2040]|uniref:dienelactone hydrolase family protein n=1 Tax=Pseudanabaena sp. FACHB-2040 TaxID=2692859 RepID=UPI001681F5E0|nr:dienelactone hydrolase family protein [Pseudanabaena sp. FACHB-2040]MBD2258713.1 dienelactone hydrolase family protein [Pseudanabaena sp. FACHB-2040]
MSEGFFQPLSRLKRRSFLIATLGAGFAAATLPIAAATISTSSDGLVAGPVEIPVADGLIPAYRAMPAGTGPFPVVLVVQEIFGVHEHIQDICRRFARQGYMAIAPEMFARQGDVSQIEDIQTIIQEVVSKVPDTQVLSDLDATVLWASGQGGDTERLGITGFCWGGRVVWLYAAHSPQLKAGVAWYGRLVGDTTPLQPQYPIEVASLIETPVLGLYGGADDGIPLSTVERMHEALGEDSASEIIVYPDAPHGFYADYRPSYREETAQEAWQQLLSWFEQNGVA